LYLNNTVGILGREALESCARYQSAATSASCSVPTASTAALICDTGALLDYLVENASDHRLFRNAIDQARTRYIPALVLAEVDYFLRNERRAMQTFMQDVARGAFTYVPPSLGQLARAMEIDRRYADLGLGLVDGSVVALAEALGIRRLATRDVRHFSAVRLADGGSFDLVVVPTDPDRS
jgi:predicted nucleic acid-binding protein